MEQIQSPALFQRPAPGTNAEVTTFEAKKNEVGRMAASICGVDTQNSNAKMGIYA